MTGLKSKTETASAVPAGVVRRIRSKAAAAVVIMAAAIVGVLSGTANAVSTDPTEGAGTTYFTGLKDYFQDHLITSVIGVVLVVVAFTLLLRWGKKSVRG